MVYFIALTVIEILDYIGHCVHVSAHRTSVISNLILHLYNREQSSVELYCYYVVTRNEICVPEHPYMRIQTTNKRQGSPVFCGHAAAPHGNPKATLAKAIAQPKHE